MCGIVAVIGDLGKTQRSVLSQLIYADTFRGADSTGIASLSFQHNVRTYKKAVPGPDFLDFKRADQLMFGLGAIAHNRWATKGAINTTNAHPFTHGPFTGVHNGTLRRQSLLPDWKDFDVDSENIFHAFNKIGVEETIATLSGAYALMWFKEDEKTVNFIRNEERPLSYSVSKDKKHVYVASEGKMLAWILDRNKVAHLGIHTCKPHVLHTFEVPSSGKAIGKVRRKTLKHYIPPPVTNINPVSRIPYMKGTAPTGIYQFLDKDLDFQIGEVKVGKGYYERDYLTLLPVEDITVDGRDIEVRLIDSRLFDELLREKKEGAWVRARTAKFPDNTGYPKHIVVVSDSIVVFDPDVEEEDGADDGSDFQFHEGFEGAILSDEEWTEATKQGCSWCTSPIVESAKNIFIDEKEFICEGCAEFPTVQEYINGGHRYGV
jgi:predicted glutamine amidotransferase